MKPETEAANPPAKRSPISPSQAALTRVPLLPQASSCTLCPLSSRPPRIRNPGILIHRLSSSLPPSPTTPALLVIGENPGFHEDTHARPFIGLSGQFLESFYLSNPALSPPFPSLCTIYITNAARCATPSSSPTRLQTSTCTAHYLPLELTSIPPPASLCILALGAPSASAVIRLSRLSHPPPSSLSDCLRFQGRTCYIPPFPLPITLFFTYHPAALLRFPTSYSTSVARHLSLLHRHLTSPTPSSLFRPLLLTPPSLPPPPPSFPTPDHPAGENP